MVLMLFRYRPTVVTSTTLEARLIRLEAELDLLRLTSRSHDSRLGHLESPREKDRMSTSEGKPFRTSSDQVSKL